MDSLTVLQNVPVKVVMTEAFRGQLVEQIRSSLFELDQEASRFHEFATQAAEPEVQQRLQEEAQRLSYQRQQLEWRIREAESVPEGAELYIQSLSVLVQLQPGDVFQDKLGMEILLKDGLVAEIRGGAGRAE
jgi:hypothetical protein